MVRIRVNGLSWGGGLAELPYPGHEHGMNHGIEILQETEVKLKEIILFQAWLYYFRAFIQR